jgi:F-type H+-transporting ATPase subunit b
MHIVWSEVVTQILGFLLTLWILRRFAWGPIVNLLEERRAKIQGEFDRIEAARGEVEGEKTRLDEELRKIDAEARKRIQEAVKEGEAVGDAIKAKAHEDARALIVRAEEEIAREKDKAEAELRQDMVGMVVRATERMIRENLDDAGHRRRIEEFIASLGQVDAGPGSGGSPGRSA